MKSYIADLGDTIDEIHLLLGEDDPYLVVVREYADPPLHALLDQSF